MLAWTADLSRSDMPRYLAIADAIAQDVAGGRLNVGDRLPPQRKLAQRLGIDFTTVARGYVEAGKRGLVESRVGQGTFIRRPRPSPVTSPVTSPMPSRAHGPAPVDLSMNLPPEPDDPELLGRMSAGLAEIGRDLVGLLRYQGFGGAQADKDAASNWLGRRALVPSHDRLLVTPGAHPALLGIFGLLAKPGDTILCEAITYPGCRSIAAQLGLVLVGLEMDEDGVTPDALTEACKRHAPKALYLNPTLHNPTTLTIPESRREALAGIARRQRLPIVEDDAYGFIPAHGPAPFAAIAPDLTWHIAGLAKCIGAGLRAAYVVAPEAKQAWPFAAAMRTATIMASPLTVALATRWIEDGTADAILRFIRAEAFARQAMAAEILPEILPKGSFRADPLAFNLWVRLPPAWTRSAFIGQMRASGVGIVASDAFTAAGPPQEAVRVCLGGPISRERLRGALEFMAHTLEETPEATSTFL